MTTLPDPDQQPERRGVVTVREIALLVLLVLGIIALAIWIYQNVAVRG